LAFAFTSKGSVDQVTAVGVTATAQSVPTKVSPLW
jgi:hypothetical protein